MTNSVKSGNFYRTAAFKYRSLKQSLGYFVIIVGKTIERHITTTGTGGIILFSIHGTVFHMSAQIKHIGIIGVVGNLVRRTGLIEVKPGSKSRIGRTQNNALSLIFETTTCVSNTLT